MFGRLVTSSPSTCAAVRPIGERGEAAPAADQPSSGHRDALHEAAQRQLVAVRAETADHADRRGREHRVTTLGLARVDVRDVHFDERHLDRRERVANREARVRVRAGVDERAVDTTPQARAPRR